MGSDKKHLPQYNPCLLNPLCGSTVCALCVAKAELAVGTVCALCVAKAELAVGTVCAFVCC